MAWYFCWLSVVFLGVTLKIIWGLVRHRETSRVIPLTILIFVLSLIFAGAWWAVWKGKSSGKGWGLFASLLSLLVSLPMLYFGVSVFWKSFLGFYWPTAVLGIAGLVAFSLQRGPNQPQAYAVYAKRADPPSEN